MTIKKSDCASVCLILMLILPEVTSSLKVYRTEQGLTTLPLDISDNATHIYLQRNLLTEIGPHAFSRFERLQQLNLRANAITSIDVNAFAGCRITVLMLRHNDLVSFPPLGSIGTTLRYLDLEDNRLEYIEPSDVKGLTVLERLHLSNNRLDKDVEFLHVLENTLIHLELLNTSIHNISDTFQNMTKLTVLSLSNGSFTDDTVSGSTFLNTSLTVLILSRMGLTTYPNLTLQASSLQRLYLSFNDFSSPGEISPFEHMDHLKLLNLERCKLNVLPDLTSLASTLEVFSINKNDISHIPYNTFENFTKLTKVSMSNNFITSMLDFRKSARTLQWLEINSVHPIGWSCDDFGQFKSLTQLELAGNSINNSGIFNCLHAPLVSLTLNRNLLSTFEPRHWPFWPNLTRLHLGRNPLVRICKVGMNIANGIGSFRHLW